MTSASNLPDKKLPTRESPQPDLARPRAGQSLATDPFTIGPWRVEPDTLSLVKVDQAARIEPKMMTLLQVLAQQPGKVVSRETLVRTLWPDVTVGEDTLARLISKLRRTLGDDAREPSFIETIPKRGYRLLPDLAPPDVARPDSIADTDPPKTRWGLAAAPVALALIAFVVVTQLPAGADSTIQRADDLYMRFTRSDNEAALALYERVLRQRPNDPDALAGIANTRVQRVVRWPGSPSGPRRGASSITEALKAGLHKSPRAQSELTLARQAGDRAVAAEPRSGRALKARGLVAAAAGHLDEARDYYQQAISAEPDGYAAQINLGEVLEIQGDLDTALKHYERAFSLMNRAYADQPQRIGRWPADLGVQIAKRHALQGRDTVARRWYEQVLVLVPLYPPATAGLAQLLAKSGDLASARALCRELADKVTEREECQALLAAPSSP